MCVPKAPKAAAPPPPPPAIVEKEPDLQITAKKKRDKKRSSPNTPGLNRFLITPGSEGAGANVPE